MAQNGHNGTERARYDSVNDADCHVDPYYQKKLLRSDSGKIAADVEEFDAEKESRILVLYTGGTIGMRSLDGVYIPAPNFLVTQLRKLPMFHDTDFIAQHTDDTISNPPLVMPLSKEGKRVIYKVWEYEPILDSCNITMTDWARLALDIKKNYLDFDGFVVLHGTDTMAYTASALSFMLENLGKPVILTGSQIPIFETRSDGRDNFLGALVIAGHYCIPEVTIYFNNKLLRGNRATKVDSGSFNAFHTPNIAPLVELEIDINVNWNAIFHESGLEKFQIHTNMCPNVGLLRLFPSITLATVHAFLQPPMEGVAIQTYGAGNGPDARDDLLRAFKEASQHGIIIVNITQCSRGCVASSYATGKALFDSGIIPGGDMTPEAALTKLSYVLGKNITLQEKCKMMGTNLKGEMKVVVKKTTKTTVTRDMSLLDFPLLTKMKETMRLSSEEEVRMLKEAIFPSLLCSAARQGKMASLVTLAAEGAQLTQADYDGRTPLHIAASEGHKDVTVYLLENGARVHQRDRYGSTPLDDAVQFNHDQIITILIKAGAHLNIPPFKMGTILCNASAHHSLKDIKSWTLAGADINQGDYDNRTALHVATSKDDREIVGFLLLLGAKVDIKDTFGMTPRDEAEKHGFKDLVNLMQNANHPENGGASFQ